ncbi:MAG: hypothetical protein HBSAPP03_00150 [Phycisphaerae bacterium]|nr:MAG: hypothetical protein HBSAPP03_00150 [Phycisphaerae bacterium]
MSLLPLAAVALAGFAGSLHCAGMCGPLACLASARPGRPVPLTHHGARTASLFAPVLALVPYHAGRALGYGVLGAVAGALGGVIDLAGSLAGVQRVALLVTGLIMIALGLWTLRRGGGRTSTPRPRAPRLASLWQRIAAWRPAARSFAVGMLTALLPCGWLWAFVLAAAGAGSAWGGVLVMLAFLIGTIPALTLTGAGLSRLLAPVLRHAPAAAGLFIIAAGVYLLTVRLPALVPHDQASAVETCHAP